MNKDRKQVLSENSLEDFTKLRRFNLFDKLSDDDLAQIAENTRVFHLRQAEVVCEEDTESESMYLVYEGAVGISRKGVSCGRGRRRRVGPVIILAIF